MSKKQTPVPVVKVKSNCPFYGSENMRMMEFIDKANAALLEIPKEYRHEAYINLDIEQDYGGYSHYIEWSVYYYRPETEQEAKERLDQEKVWAEQQKANARRMLEQAKKILGEE